MKPAVLALIGLPLSVFGNLYSAPTAEAVGGALLVLGAFFLIVGSRSEVGNFGDRK